MGNLSQYGFDAATTEHVETSFDPLPNGEYVVAIMKSELRNNKAGTGNYIWLELEVVEGEHKKRKLWAQLTFQHQSEMARKIGQSQFADVCKAVGVPKPNDTSELHHKPLAVEVQIEKREDNGKLTNNVRRFFGKIEMSPQDPANDDSAPW